jgi:hypothetical protein
MGPEPAQFLLDRQKISIARESVVAFRFQFLLQAKNHAATNSQASSCFAWGNALFRNQFDRFDFVFAGVGSSFFGHTGPPRMMKSFCFNAIIPGKVQSPITPGYFALMS